ncbi:MAG: hypothetical protein ACLPKB_00780 [Xanthobacteraceae bacterium]
MPLAELYGGACELLAQISNFVVQIFSKLGWEKTAVVVLAIFACGGILKEMFALKWGQLRYYGMPRWVFELAWAAGAFLIFCVFTGAIVHILLDINTLIATPVLGTIVVGLTGLYVIFRLRDRSTFDRLKFLSLVVARLLPFEVVYSYKIVIALIRPVVG